MNRRRHANVVPVAQIATWVLIVLFAACGGLYWVYCKNQLHARGDQIKGLERELAELRTQHEVVRARIAVLNSPNALRKLRESRTFLTEYVDVTADRIVRVVDQGGPNSSDLRPVVNQLR